MADAATAMLEARRVHERTARAEFYAVREGYLDRVPVEEVEQFLDELCRRLDELDPDLLLALENEAKLSDTMQARLRHAIEAVQQLLRDTMAHDS